MARTKQVDPQRVAAAKALATKRVAEAPANDEVQAKVARAEASDAEKNAAHSNLREAVGCYYDLKGLDRLKAALERGEAVGIDVEYSDPKKTLVIPMAMALSGRRYVQEAIELMGKYGFQVDRPDNHGNTALMDAAQGGYLESVKAFFAAGAQINCQGGRSKWTPLHYAVSAMESEVVQYLLEHGARFDIKDVQGKTAKDLVGMEEDGEEIMELFNSATKAA